MIFRVFSFVMCWGCVVCVFIAESIWHDTPLAVIFTVCTGMYAFAFVCDVIRNRRVGQGP